MQGRNYHMNLASASINQKHTVKVNNGSGVLIQPMSSDYAYVLTAKHCLQENKEDPHSALKESHTVLLSNDEPINIKEVIHHDTKDIAILIVPPTTGFDLMINCEPLTVNKQFRLCGYPSDRNTLAEQYSSFLYNYAEKVDERLIFTPSISGVVHSTISGFSGGGIFTLGEQGNPVLLCAIETKMDGNVDREFHGSISAFPVSEFEQLINDPKSQYQGKALAILSPLHLSSFEHLINFSFNISKSWTIEHRLNFLIDRLKDIATKDIKVNLYPHEILVNFKDSLKVHSRPQHELQSKELWVALLELLTISILIDKPETIDTTYVEKILQSRKLVFIGVNETWQQHITDIFKAELKSFNNGGIVVAKTFSTQREVQFSKDRVRKLIDAKHIARPPKDIHSITNTKSNISKINSIVDLSALHAECIEIKESLYEELTDITKFDEEKHAELRAVLAKEYGTYLTVKDSTDE